MSHSRGAAARKALAIAGVFLSGTWHIAPGAPSEAEAAAGAQVFRRWCSECHGPGALPGTGALERRYQGTVPAALEERTDLSGALIRYTVRNGRSFMPFFRKTEISDAELAALSAYLTRPRR